MPRAGRAGAHAGRNAILRREGLVVDAVDAQRAFLHHAVVVVVLARAVGAGPGAQLAADAGVGIDQHDAVRRALVGGAGRADGDAGRRLAMQTGAREMHGAARRAVAHLVGVHAVEPGAVRIAAVGVLVGQRRGIAAGVPLLAACRAGLAADAGVEIDHQPELLCGVFPAGWSWRGLRRGMRRRMQRLELREGFAGFVRRGLLDADAEIVPGRLAGDRIAVGEAIAALALGQQLGDEMIEQEAARRFRRVGDRARPRRRAGRSRSRSTPCRD